MPILEIHSEAKAPGTELLDEICSTISEILLIPENLVWIRWNLIMPDEFYYKGYKQGISAQRPIVFINCKETYSTKQVGSMMKTVSDILSNALGCSAEAIFVAVRRVRAFELTVNGKIWEGENNV